MKRILLLLCCVISLSLFGQVPTFEWATHIGGNSLDEGRSIATDRWGNIFVTGEFRGNADFDFGPTDHILTAHVGMDDFYSDAFVAKYDPDGQLEWAYSFGDTLNDWGASIVTDSIGDVYIIGHFFGAVDFDPGPDTTYLPNIGSSFILKLSGNGSFIWAKRFAGSLSLGGESSLAVDETGNTYITGDFTNTDDFDPGPGVYNLTSTGDHDIFILKLNKDGDFVWAKSVGGGEWDSGLSIALDSSNNVYTTGIFRSDADFDPGSGTFILNACGGQFDRDAFILKLNSDGDFVWAKSIGNCTDNITSTGIAVSEAGEVYTTGSFLGTLDFNPGPAVFNLSAVWELDVFILKLNSEGGFVWANSIGSWGSEGGNAIALDKSNNIYATGFFDGTIDFDAGPGVFNLTSDETDIFILKMDESGNFVWAGGLTGDGGGALPNSIFASGHAITIDPWDNVYSTGHFTGTTDFDADINNYELTASGEWDVFIHKMSQQPCMSSPVISSNESFPICPGENIQLRASLPSSATNISYSWNTGNISDSILASPDTNTIYSVTATYNNDTTVCVSVASIEVVVVDPVIISVNEDLIICAQDEFVLEAGGGIAYLWNTGDSTNIVEIIADENQVYSVTVTDDNDCAGSDSVTVFVHPLSDTTYLEMTSCDTSQIGLIIATYFDQNGCDSVVVENTILIPIPEMPTAPVDIIVPENAPPFSLMISEVVDATEYLWTVPAGVQIVSGQGTNSIIIDWGSTTTNGSICVSAINECGSSVADCTEVMVDIIDGVNSTSENEFSIFPNPAKEVINIVFEDKKGNYVMSLFDLLGRQIFLNERFVGQVQIELKNIPSGVYWLELKEKNAKAVPVFAKIEVIK